MSRPPASLKTLLPALCALAFVILAAGARASSYEAELPVQLKTGADLCSYVPCRDVLPGATHFSPRMGHPAYAEAYGDSPFAGDGERKEADDGEDRGAKQDGDGKHDGEGRQQRERRREGDRKNLVGYVFLSTDIVDIPAYSGKPVVTLIGMDVEGKIVGIKILKHSEPILLVGIPEAQLTKFINQFVGKKAWDKVEIGRARAEGGYLGIDAISGATVTVISENQVVMRSAYLVAREVGIVKAEPKPPAVFTAGQPLRDWAALLDEGSVQRLQVSAADVGDTTTREPLIDMYFGYLNTPAIGQSILGAAVWQRLMDRLGPHDHAIFIAANGRTSFKGSGFVRGGIFDRIQVAQDIDTVTFRDTDYLNLYGIEAAGAPTFTESAIFIMRSEAFSAAYPWSLVFLANKMDPASGTRTFANFDREYWLPEHYLVGGHPKVVKPEAAWVKIWTSRWIELVAFTALLLGVATVYALRDRLTRRSTRHNKWPVNGFKYVAWVFSVGFIGFYLMAQPSITQVLTWFHALLFEWTWQLFLSDPFIFIFWIFIAVTVFLWGRGLFCGWLCPFGSLTEILYKVGGLVGLKRFQFKLSKPWHDRLKWVKYGIFFVLLAVSFFSMGLAEKLAEVEPFKTTFLVGLLNRTWPFTVFATALLGLSIFIERPFCKYVCPLGASLAMPSTFRWFGLKRKQECNTCTACAVGCGSLAIDRHGRIDQRECLLCLDCMVFYTDDHACPPLAKERKHREKSGEPLTPIGKDGYFTPVKMIPVTQVAVDTPVAAATTTPRRGSAAGVDPRMPSDPVEPPYAAQESLWRFLLAELRDHLWPFSQTGFTQQPVVELIGGAVLLAAAAVAALAIGGQIPPVSVLGAWTGWSLFEVLVRMGARPYVKEGPWWQRHYRAATWMDMLSYVGFKNLLAGAVLFVVLKSFGLLAL